MTSYFLFLFFIYFLLAFKVGIMKKTIWELQDAYLRCEIKLTVDHIYFLEINYRTSTQLIFTIVIHELWLHCSHWSLIFLCRLTGQSDLKESLNPFLKQQKSYISEQENTVITLQCKFDWAIHFSHDSLPVWGFCLLVLNTGQYCFLQPNLPGSRDEKAQLEELSRPF